MPTKIEVPRLINIADFKSTPRKAILMHFTDDQWKQASKGATEVRALKKGSSYVEYTPLPDGGGVVNVSCQSSPEETCIARPVLERPEPLPGPGPRPGPGPGPGPGPAPLPTSRGSISRAEGFPVRWECQCRPTRGPGVLVPVLPPCELVFERTPRLRVRCVRRTCSGICVMRRTIVNGSIRLSCECS